jgi:hypothetical protein
MHIESGGVATGDPERPFLARITIGSRNKRETLAEFEAPSLAAAERDAEDWMNEYCARVGLGGAKLLNHAAMRSRWDRLRDGMPKFPEPGDAYLRALEDLAFAGVHTADIEETPPIRSRPRSSYPTRSKIVSAVAAARAADIDVAGIRIWPDGSIAVFDSRGVADGILAEDADAGW